MIVRQGKNFFIGYQILSPLSHVYSIYLNFQLSAVLNTQMVFVINLIVPDFFRNPIRLMVNTILVELVVKYVKHTCCTWISIHNFNSNKDSVANFSMICHALFEM